MAKIIPFPGVEYEEDEPSLYDTLTEIMALSITEDLIGVCVIMQMADGDAEHVFSGRCYDRGVMLDEINRAFERLRGYDDVEDNDA